MTSWNQEYKRATVTSNITIFPPVIEPGGNTMTSTVDSMRNVVETDSCPRSHRSILASPAKFVLRHPYVLPNKNDSEAFTTRQTTIKNIPPPPPPTTTTTQPHFLAVSGVPYICLSYCIVSGMAKILKGTQQKRLGPSWIYLYPDWRLRNLFLLRNDIEKLGTLRRCLPRTYSLVQTLSVCSNGDWRKIVN